MSKNEQVSVEERVKNEKHSYNKKIDRRKYNAAFGHAQGGYPYTRRNKIYASVLKKEKNKRILEIGSTSWKKFVNFKEYCPSKLVCINISEIELEKGRKIAKESETKNHEFKVMDAHNLEFPDNSFDIIFGQEILHHLDIAVFAKEAARVLEEEGQIVFVEPLGGNPVGKLVRWLTPTKRTDFEEPLNRKHLKALAKYFDLDLAYNQLFYVPFGALSKFIFKSPRNPLTFIAYKLDRLIEMTFGKIGFGVYFRQVVIKGKLKKQQPRKQQPRKQ